MRCGRRLTPLLWIPISAAAVVGCGAEPDMLRAFFEDEVVEAPARTVGVAVVDGLRCGQVLEIAHDRLEDAAPVFARSTFSYPVRPDAAPFEDVPRGRLVAVDVAAFDESGQRVGRGCTEVEFEDGRSARVDVLLEPLPTCDSPYRSLHVGLVVDRSLAARDADIALENALLARLANFVREFAVPGGVSWTILDHGPEAPGVRIANSADIEAVTSTLEQRSPAFGGQAAHYEALEITAAALRSDALCPRRPVVLWIGADEDHSAPIAINLARSAVIGTETELQDDLFVFAIALASPGLSVMQDLFAVLERTQLEGAGTLARLDDALLQATFLFQGLVE